MNDNGDEDVPPVIEMKDFNSNDMVHGRNN